MAELVCNLLRRGSPAYSLGEIFARITIAERVLEDMVQRLRAIELLLRTQNELLTTVLTELGA